MVTRTISKAAAWPITACLALIVLCVPAARGACLNWGHGMANPDTSNLFVGKIGDQSVAMLLHLNPKTGRFDGAYGYANQSDTSALTGSMLLPGVGLVLDAHDKQGVVASHFSLLFFYPISTSTNLNFYKKWYINSCDTMTGIWQPSNGGNAKYVILFMSGQRKSSQTNTLKLNDATAYKLNMAIRKNDRKAFASLLHYPFCTASALGIHKVFTTPSNVIRNYKEIISTLPQDTPAFYMPHFITNDSFMNGSVYFEDGKVALICLGHCPDLRDNPCSETGRLNQHKPAIRQDDLN